MPEGTTFTAELFCLSPIIIDGESGTDTATVTFDATGQPTSADTFYFGDPGECTVTETADGGAATTTYACEGVLPAATPDSTGFRGAAVPEDQVCTAAGPQADPIPVNIIHADQSATVTIANTFVAPEPPPPTPPPPPPPPVAVAPAFTG